MAVGVQATDFIFFETPVCSRRLLRASAPWNKGARLGVIRDIRAPAAPKAGGGDRTWLVRRSFLRPAGRSASPASLLDALEDTGAPSAPLTGAFDDTDMTTQMTAPWPFVANALPTLFGNGTITSAAGSIPNVYAGP